MAKEDDPICISCGVHNIKHTFTEWYAYSQGRKNSTVSVNSKVSEVT